MSQRSRFTHDHDRLIWLICSVSNVIGWKRSFLSCNLLIHGDAIILTTSFLPYDQKLVSRASIWALCCVVSPMAAEIPGKKHVWTMRDVFSHFLLASWCHLLKVHTHTHTQVKTLPWLSRVIVHSLAPTLITKSHSNLNLESKLVRTSCGLQTTMVHISSVWMWLACVENPLIWSA